MRTIKSMLLLGLMATASSTAFAQSQSVVTANPTQTSVDNGTTLDDIVVTATKKSQAETAQSIPTAISAFSGEQIADKHIPNLTQLANSVPGVQFDQGGAFKGSANFSMRGLGVTSSIPTVEGTVGVFIDGIYVPTSQGVLTDLFDLDGIEVLRGPQGTLFGKNVTGGAVLLRSRNPSRTFGVDTRVSVETGLEVKAAASITGPITPTLSARVTLSYGNDDGWFRDSVNGLERGKARTVLIRPSVFWEPAEGFDTLLKYEHGAIKGDSVPTQNGAYFDPDTFRFGNDYIGLTDLTWSQVTSETHIDVGLGDNGVITNLFGYRHLRDQVGQDIDSTASPFFRDEHIVKSNVYSNELRYSGRVFDRADLVVGLYYFKSFIIDVEQRRLAALGQVPRTFGGEQDHESYAAFAQADVTLSDPLILTLGGRYGHDKKTARVAVFSGAADVCNYTTLACNYGFNDTDSWKSFTPKVGLRYEFGPNQQVYASFTRAYRAGGFNIRITNPLQNRKFDQEANSVIEIGAKIDLLDNRLRLNVAAYQNKVDNIIRDVNAATTLGSGTIGTVQDSRNTADVTIRGAEGELLFKPVRNLTLGTFVSYTKPEYDTIRFSLIERPGETLPVINAADYALELPRVPRWTYGVNAELRQDLSADLETAVRVDFSHRDSAFGADNNLVKLRKLDMLNGSIRFALKDDRLSVSVFGRNLLNEVYSDTVGSLPPSLQPAPYPGNANSVNYATLQEGRVYGFELSSRF